MNIKLELRSIAIAVLPTLALASVIALTGCSSAPKQTASGARQFCYTSQEIRTKNKETVSSETLVKCNDDPIERIVIKKAGMAENCGWTSNWVTLPNGKMINDRYITCFTEGGRMVRINPDPS
jgi:hypothetical protein